MSLEKASGGPLGKASRGSLRRSTEVSKGFFKRSIEKF
jgi:hypothetical protein